MNFKKIKIFLLLSSLPLTFFIFTISSHFLSKNSVAKKENKTNLDINQLNSNVARNTHVNSIPRNEAPSDFGQTQPLFQTDSSQAIVTNFGYLGFWKERNVLFMVSYSGFLIWWQNLSINPIIQSYYQENSLTLTNLFVKEFAYLDKKNALVILLGDNLNNQSIVVIDAKTGLLWNPIVDNNINITNAPIYSVKKLLSDTTDEQPFTRLYKVSDDTVIATKLGNYSTYKDSVKITLNSGTNNSSISKISLPNVGNNENDLLVGIIKASSNRAMALIRDANETNSGNKTYKLKVRLIDTNDFENQKSYKNLTELSNQYIADSDDTNNSYMNFSYIYNNKIYVLTGNTNQRTLNELSISNDEINENKTNDLDLSNYGINTIVADSTNNILYIGNKTTKDQSVAGYVDLTKKPIYQSMVISSSTRINPYYVIPVLEKIGNSSRQNILYSDSSQKMKLMYRNLKQDTSFTPDNLTISLIDRDWDVFGNITKNADWFLNKMASNINWNDVSNAISFSSWKSNTTTPIQGSMTNNSNNDYGWTKLIIKVTYNWSFDTTQKASFEIPIYINGFYQLKENFKFQFVTNSNIDETKWNKIQELMSTKFAKNITVDDVFNYFWIGNIKDKNGNNVSITKNMFSLSYSQNYNQLSVILKLPWNSFPDGFPYFNYVQQYNGFLSIEGYDLSIKNDNAIANVVNKIYPSELTKNKVLDLLNIGSKIQKNLDYWDIEINNIDDLMGDATLTVKYKYQMDTNIPDINNFPVSRFNVVENKKITTFKNLKNSFNFMKASIKDVTSNLLPSEIWQEYQNYLSNLSSTSLLIKNLNVNFTNINNIKIELLNANSCDADKMLKLSLTIKDDAPINVDYSGNQLHKNDEDKLLFSSEIKRYLTQLNKYPFTLNWSITTLDKIFEIQGPDGTYIQQVDNVYYIDVRKINDTSYLLSKNQYANQVNEEMLSKLIQIQGYTYAFQDYQVNNDKGYILATIHLQIKNDSSSKLNLNLTNKINQNFERKIYIYNFKLPLPNYVNVIIYLVIGILSLVIIATSIAFCFYMRKNIKYSELGQDQKLLVEKRKRQELWNRKQRLSEKIKKENN